MYDISLKGFLIVFAIVAIYEICKTIFYTNKRELSFEKLAAKKGYEFFSCYYYYTHDYVPASFDEERKIVELKEKVEEISSDFNLFHLGYESILSNILIKDYGLYLKMYFEYSYKLNNHNGLRVNYHGLIFSFKNKFFPEFILYDDTFFQITFYKLKKDYLKKESLSVDNKFFSERYSIYGEDHQSLQYIFNKNLIEELSLTRNYYIEGNGLNLIFYQQGGLKFSDIEPWINVTSSIADKFVPDLHIAKFT